MSIRSYSTFVKYWPDELSSGMDDKGAGVGIASVNAGIAGTCATCGRPLTQCGPNGECLRCLASIWLLEESEQPERSGVRVRLTPGSLRYAHFEVEIGADGS